MNLDSEDKKSKKNNESSKTRWVYRACMMAFGLSVFFSFISEMLLDKVNIIISLIILLIIIAIGIIFDIIGIAVASANEAPFHAMAADKTPGGKEAVRLVKNADIVSNFCNDIVGDICGIISGAAGAAIVVKIAVQGGSNKEIILKMMLTGLISMLTVGGKAAGKSIAINNSKTVVQNVALFLYVLNNKLHIDILPKSNGTKRKKQERN